MTRKDKEKHSIFLISIALMALRIRKKMFHHNFCGHPVEDEKERFFLFEKQQFFEYILRDSVSELEDEKESFFLLKNNGF